MTLLRTRVGLLDALSRPVLRTYSPYCMTCNRELDSEALVEGAPGVTTFARVLGRHHRAEQLVTFDMGSVEWDHDDLARHMRGFVWFDPRRIE